MNLVLEVEMLGLRECAFIAVDLVFLIVKRFDTQTNFRTSNHRSQILSNAWS